MYIHLHGHSHYSLLEGIGKVPSILSKAKQLGYDTIGLTDYDGMYGVMEFISKAKKSEIKPIVWIEIQYVNQLCVLNDIDQYIVLIAKNYLGYQNLMKLTTYASTIGLTTNYPTNKNKKIPTIELHARSKYAEGVIMLIGGNKSYLNMLLKNSESKDKIYEQIKIFKDIFSQDLYLELIAQDNRKEPKVKDINQCVVEISDKYDIPMIVSTNYHYINKDDKESFEVAMAIKDSRQIGDHDRRRVWGDYFITSPEDVREVLISNGMSNKSIEILFERNQEVADKIDLQMPQVEWLFPNYNTPEKIKDIYSETEHDMIEI